jgi:hypothetical protein
MNRRILNSDDEEFYKTLSDRNFQLESEKDDKFYIENLFTKMSRIFKYI